MSVKLLLDIGTKFDTYFKTKRTIHVCDMGLKWPKKMNLIILLQFFVFFVLILMWCFNIKFILIQVPTIKKYYIIKTTFLVMFAFFAKTANFRIGQIFAEKYEQLQATFLNILVFSTA